MDEVQLPTFVKGIELTSTEKVRRVLEGTTTRGGELAGGIMQPDGTFDEDQFLAMYDKIGGGMRLNGDSVKMGSFYDFRKKAPKDEPEIMLSFRINGEVMDVPANKPAPAIVEADRAMKKLKADAEDKEVKKKKK